MTERLRLGFIGAGWRATTNHMPILAARADIEVAAVCRPDADLLRTVEEHFDFPFATERFEERSPTRAPCSSGSLGLRAANVSARRTSPGSGVDMYKSAAAFEGGAINAVSGAATLPDDDPFQVDLRIFGDEGFLLLDVEQDRLEFRRHGGRHRRVEIPPGDEAYSCEGPPNRFVELIGDRGTNDSPGEVAARSVALIEAMCRSAHGTPVSVNGSERVEIA